MAMCEDLRARFPADLLRARGQDFTVDRAAGLHVALFKKWPPYAGRRAFGLGFVRCSAVEIAARMATESPAAAMLVATPNVDHVRLLKDTSFRTAYGAAEIVCADGWPVALYAAWRRAAPWRRVTGCDILHALVAHPDTARRRVFAVVESHRTARSLHYWLRARGLDRNWSITVAEQALARDAAAQRALAGAIAALRPDILIMTLGAPVSEVFVHRHRDALPPCWALCVGQALRVEIGVTGRAPGFLRWLGLEWAWRCTQEPWRLAPRYIRAAGWFPWAVLLDLAGRRPGLR
jgi:N-acetylglucosaminyldiphosphoundecaprenol N-acetyl-beta-D-mannosaminyltransferase